jgi:hypothetical protein
MARKLARILMIDMPLRVMEVIVTWMLMKKKIPLMTRMTSMK